MMDLATVSMAVFLQAGGGEDSLSTGEAIVGASAIIAGATMITAIVAILIWQGLGTWRARMQIAREQAYQKLSEEMAENLRMSSMQLQRMTDELAEMRARTAEIERLLKEV